MSFLAILAIHEQLDELFLLHQEALLQLDLALAAARLREFERELRMHMQVEEELLLPVYRRAGRVPGGPPEFFTGEHQRLLALLARIAESLERLTPGQPGLHREIIRLFDAGAAFKSLMEHHDQRERNLFFPKLDQLTDESERATLLAACRARQDWDRRTAQPVPGAKA